MAEIEIQEMERYIVYFFLLKISLYTESKVSRWARKYFMELARVFERVCTKYYIDEGTLHLHKMFTDFFSLFAQFSNTVIVISLVPAVSLRWVIYMYTAVFFARGDKKWKVEEN